MTFLEINTPIHLFNDLNGEPLENGYIYIGQENLNPETNPITTYWDKELTQLAAQPIRTISGYPSRYGTPSKIFINSQIANYSITVKNKNQSVVYYSKSSNGYQANNDLIYIAETIDDLQNVPSDYLCAIVQDENRGGTFIYDSSKSAINNYGTIFNGWVRQYSGAINVLWFGAKGDGLTDDSLSIQRAINVGGQIYVPLGQYRLESDLEVNSTTTPVSFLGVGKQSTYGSGAVGSVLKRIGVGNVIRCGVLSDGTGTKTFPRLSMQGMIIQGDGTTTQTGLLMYWSRVTIRDCSFFDLYDGINFPASPADEYSDLCVFNNIRFGNIRGTRGLRHQGGDNALFQNLNFEGNTCNANLEVRFARGAVISNILNNSVKSEGIIVNYCQGVTVNGVHSEGAIQNGASYILIRDSDGIDVRGCYISHNQVASITGCIGVNIVRETRSSRNIRVTNNTFVTGNGGLTDYSVVGAVGDTMKGIEIASNTYLNADATTSRTTTRVRTNTEGGSYTSRVEDNSGGFTVYNAGSRTAYMQDADIYSSVKYTLGAGVTWTSGTGSPEGVVTAIVGSLYSRTDGGTTTTLYVKTSGTGNTGWTAK